MAISYIHTRRDQCKDEGHKDINFKLLSSQPKNKAFYFTCGNEIVICYSKILHPDLYLMSW